MGTGLFPANTSMLRAMIGVGIRLYGSIGGYVGIKPAANAGGTDYTLPSSAPSVNGQLLQGTTAGVLSWVNPVINYTWSEITVGTVALVAWGAYILNNSSRVIATLPATATVGTQIRVCGKGAGGWRIAQNTGQSIHFGAQQTTSGPSGSISSVNSFDSVELVCITADSDWLVLNSQGNVTIV